MKVGRRQGDSDHFLYIFRSALIQYLSRLVSSLVRPCKCRAKTVNINTKALASQQLYTPPVTWRMSHILYAPSQIGLSSLNGHRFRNNSEKKKYSQMWQDTLHSSADHKPSTYTTDIRIHPDLQPDRTLKNFRNLTRIQMWLLTKKKMSPPQIVAVICVFYLHGSLAIIPA